VSVLCPGWVRTRIAEADRNWPASLGERPERDAANEVMFRHFSVVLDEGTPPAAIADKVADAVQANRFWVIPHDDFLDLAIDRWETIKAGADPTLGELPGLGPLETLQAEALAALEQAQQASTQPAVTS
jgi:hypothetical protein